MGRARCAPCAFGCAQVKPQLALRDPDADQVLRSRLRRQLLKHVLRYHNTTIAPATVKPRAVDDVQREDHADEHRSPPLADDRSRTRRCERAAFDAAPGPGEVVVAIAGCGVCHTDLGYFYDGVRTNHAAAAGAGPRGQRPRRGLRRRRRALGRQGGDRAGGAALRRMRSVPARPGHHLPHSRRCRATTSRAASPATSWCPARGLCEVDEARLARAGLTLAEVSIVADALTTPYQAVRRAGVTPGSLAIVVGAGGVGGYCVQVARAFGADGGGHRRRRRQAGGDRARTAPR